MSLLQKYRENRYCRHTRESGNPEVFDFKEYWIPDKDLGNDEYRLLQEPHVAGDGITGLSGDSIIYSAGYGHMLKPIFILAELSQKAIKGNYTIYRVNRELARDLSTSPAMIQGNTVIARQETTQMFLWVSSKK